MQKDPEVKRPPHPTHPTDPDPLRHDLLRRVREARELPVKVPLRARPPLRVSVGVRGPVFVAGSIASPLPAARSTACAWIS
jgi:hypothetical protein